jgi:ribosome-binding factor A
MKTNSKTSANSANNFRLRRSSKLENVLNDIFSKSEFFSGSRQVFINVLRVDMDKNLTSAKVFVDMFGLEPENQRDLLGKLNGSFLRQIRKIVADRIRAKSIPRFLFCHASDSGKESRILGLMREYRQDTNAQ